MKIKKLLCGALVALMAVSTVGCGGGSSSGRPTGDKQVYFWAWGDARQEEMYQNLVNTFNKTVAAIKRHAPIPCTIELKISSPSVNERRFLSLSKCFISFSIAFAARFFAFSDFA